MSLIYSCDCEGFKQKNGISFDTQDLHVLGYQRCPCCQKPFKSDEPEIVKERLAKLAPDGRCSCSCADRCPRGKIGTTVRCSKELLEGSL